MGRAFPRPRTQPVPPHRRRKTQHITPDAKVEGLIRAYAAREHVMHMADAYRKVLWEGCKAMGLDKMEESK